MCFESNDFLNHRNVVSHAAFRPTHHVSSLIDQSVKTAREDSGEPGLTHFPQINKLWIISNDSVELPSE